MANSYKTCPNCSEIWPTRDAFIADKRLKLNGYKVDFEKPEYGLFFFTHIKPGCCSTMALEVNAFKDLYSGFVYPERKTGSDECPRYCFDEEQFDRCHALCGCAFVREILQLLIK